MNRKLLSPRTVLRKGTRVALSRYYLRGCTEVGSLPRVWGKPRIVNNGRLKIGNKPMFFSHTVRVELVVKPGAQMHIGDNVLINFGTTIVSYGDVKIGNRVKMGVYTIISDSDEHRIEPERRDELPQPEPVVIEDDVWIADRVTVLKGVHIGQGSVVGAGSVVTRDIPAYSIAVGNPARVIRRISQVDVEAVLDIDLDIKERKLV